MKYRNNNYGKMQGKNTREMHVFCYIPLSIHVWSAVSVWCSQKAMNIVMHIYTPAPLTLAGFTMSWNASAQLYSLYNCHCNIIIIACKWIWKILTIAVGAPVATAAPCLRHYGGQTRVPASRSEKKHKTVLAICQSPTSASLDGAARTGQKFVHDALCTPGVGEDLSRDVAATIPLCPSDGYQGEYKQ